jgi:hypothetical protein
VHRRAFSKRGYPLKYKAYAQKPEAFTPQHLEKTDKNNASFLKIEKVYLGVSTLMY